MDKLQEIKEKTKKYREALYNSPSDFNHNFSAMDDIKWLIDKVEELDNGNLKTYQKATERINGLEKQIQELQSEIIVLNSMKREGN